jgi:CMP-N,N'-diacetyllegionaminic acid synthase
VTIFKYLAIIPARKNSKRIKDKNLKKINKKTLVDIAIDEAKKVKKIDYIVVTSDSKKILDIAKKKGVLTIKRPLKYCTDKSTTEDALLHSISILEKKNLFFKNIILLQPTSPQRTSKDINDCIKEYEKEKVNSMFSGYFSKEFLWQIKNKIKKSISYNYLQRKRSQNMRPLFFENGAIYIFNCILFKKIKNRIMKPFKIYEMSKFKSIDLDTKNDLIHLRRILK